MRQVILLSIILMVISGSTPAQEGSIQSGNETRTFLVHISEGLPENPTLVLSMHGLGGSSLLHEVRQRLSLWLRIYTL